MAYAPLFPLSQIAQQSQVGKSGSPAAPPQPTYGPDLAVRLICPDCNDETPNIAEEFGAGDLVCRNCGLVLGDRIVDTRSEWRTFANDEGDDPSRVGAASDPLMQGIDQLETLISFRDGGSGSAKELQRAASRGQSSRAERNLLTAFRDIGSWCDQFSMPNTVRDIAKQLYKRSDEEKLLRGKPLEAVIAACIFIACRQAHVPRTFREICNLTNVPKKLLGQCYKQLELTFNLSPGATGSTRTDGSRSSGTESIIPRFVNQLDLPAFVQTMCADVIVAARKHGVADGRSPVSVAGAAIYFVCHLVKKPKTAREIGQIAGVTEGTIKLVYRLFYEARRLLVAHKWIAEGRVDVRALPADATDRTPVEVPAKKNESAPTPAVQGKAPSVAPEVKASPKAL